MGWGAAIGAAITAVGSIAGGREAKKGAKSAASAQIAGQEAAITEQRDARRQFAKLQEPFRNIGIEAASPVLASLGLGPTRDQLLSEQQILQNRLEGRGNFVGRETVEKRLSQIQGILGSMPGELPQVELSALPAAPAAFDPSAVQDNPIFDFLLEEGFRGIREGAGGTGRDPSRDLVRFAQGTAATLVPQLQQQQFGQQSALRGTALAEQAGLRADALSEQQQRINNLMNVLGIGQAAAAGTGAAGLSTANQIGSALGGIGAAGAQSALQQSQARQNALGGLVGAAGMALGGSNFGGFGDVNTLAGRPIDNFGQAQMGPTTRFGGF